MDRASSFSSPAVSWDFCLGKGEGRATPPFRRVLGWRPLPVSPFSTFLGPTTLCHSRVHFGLFGARFGEIEAPPSRGILEA